MGKNGTEWFGRRIRVQYCESQEMKAKRRENKYMNSMEQYYANLQVPSSVYMVRVRQYIASNISASCANC